MKLCLLSYDAPHRKTAQVYQGLKNAGRHDLDFLLVPFHERAKRDVMFEHRPCQFEGCGARELAKADGARIFEYANWRSILEDYDYFIVCGANLLEREFARSGKVVNVHSGLIPQSRGLDSFKWDIFHQKPVGCTLHVIDELADKGRILGQVLTPIFRCDGIATFAQRHYETEIWMLQNFDEIITRGPKIPLTLCETEATRRMSIETEGKMLRSFDSFKERYAAS